MATEKRLIDANKYFKIIRDDIEIRPMCFRRTVNHLNEMETVDAVEVVRCKDCIHWYEPDGVCLKIYSDVAVSPYAWQDRNPEDFCSYGERKADGKE